MAGTILAMRAWQRGELAPPSVPMTDSSQTTTP
jgi:hypothetical protein